MQCPFCRGPDTKVVDSRDTENGQAIRRRRECISCGQRYTTFERVEGVPLVVAKRDGHREAFDRAKVVSGIAKACKNRPVSDESMRAICDQIEEIARERGGEIASADLGNEILTRLSALDEVAYVRFASVYREFSDVTEFEQVISELDKGSKGVGGQG
ncbi:MAG: transcriptional regulator NrdR [Actinomycetota bacterium]